MWSLGETPAAADDGLVSGVALLWLLGLAVAVMFGRQRGYVAATIDLIRWPYHTAWHYVLRMVGLIVSTTGRLGVTILTHAVVWFVRRIREW